LPFDIGTFRQRPPADRILLLPSSALVFLLPALEA
jgi:hypothetical protein